MKRILLLAMISSFMLAGYAQKGLTLQPRLKNTVATQTNVITDEMAPLVSETNPYISSNRDQDIVVGDTWYDLQSNSTMPRRIYAYDDGTMAAVWTMSLTETWSDRGTGYNYFDGQDWGPAPTERIESVRTGWPSYAPYGENGEIICAHDFGVGDLVFSWRENKGEGEWNTFTLNGPEGYDFMAWARVCTSGENRDIIHVIANLPISQNGGGSYEGLNGTIVYSRSMDGGQTWDPENVILDGMDADYAKAWGADDYAWAEPNAGVIAFVVFGGVADGIIMKSDDDGDTWERVTFYESPDPFFDGNGGDLPQCGGGDGYNAITIDDDGIVHVAFGRQIHLDDTPDDDSWSYYPYSDGLIYWNETMPPLDTAQIKADILPDDWSAFPIYQNGQLAAWTQPNGEDTIIGVAPYYASLTSMPQLIMHDGIVQIFYSALSVGFATDDYNYRHIWGRFKENDVWSDYTDYTGDIFHVISECVYPSLAPKTFNGYYHLLYQTDQLPGNSLQPDPPTHPPVDNKIVYLPVMMVPVGIEDQMAQTNFEVSQNYPNPATGETMIVVNTEAMGPVQLTVNNVLGQVVYRTTENATHFGNHTFTLNVSGFDPGIYFYSVKIGEKAVTKKMLIK